MAHVSLCHSTADWLPDLTGQERWPLGQLMHYEWRCVNSGHMRISHSFSSLGPHAWASRVGVPLARTV